MPKFLKWHLLNMHVHVLTEFSNKLSSPYIKFIGSCKPDNQYLACKTHLGHDTRAHTHHALRITRVKAPLPSFQVLPERGYAGVPAPLTHTRVSNRLKCCGQSLTIPINNSLVFSRSGPHLFFLQAIPKSVREGRIESVSRWIRANGQEEDRCHLLTWLWGRCPCCEKGQALVLISGSQQSNPATLSCLFWAQNPPTSGEERGISVGISPTGQAASQAGAKLHRCHSMLSVQTVGTHRSNSSPRKCRKIRRHNTLLFGIAALWSYSSAGICDSDLK